MGQKNVKEVDITKQAQNCTLNFQYYTKFHGFAEFATSARPGSLKLFRGRWRGC